MCFLFKVLKGLLKSMIKINHAIKTLLKMQKETLSSMKKIQAIDQTWIAPIAKTKPSYIFR
jgi:hypothetical protein